MCPFIYVFVIAGAHLAVGQCAGKPDDSLGSMVSSMDQDHLLLSVVQQWYLAHELLGIFLSLHLITPQVHWTVGVLSHMWLVVSSGESESLSPVFCL